MWAVDDNFKSESVRNHSTPFYKNILYNDIFNFTLNGTENIYFYNSNNEKVFAFVGTSTQSGFTWNGTNLTLGTGGTIGTWISPIITPFYEASWHSLCYSDSTKLTDLSDNCLNIGWTNIEQITRQSIFIQADDYDFVYYGSFSEGNRIKIVNYGSQITQVNIQDHLLCGTTWFNYGEWHCSAQVDDIMPLDIFKMENDDGNFYISLSYEMSGTHMLARLRMNEAGGFGYYLELGTAGTGIDYFYDCDLTYAVADKVVLGGWMYSKQGGSLVGTYIQGTANGRPTQNKIYSKFYVGRLNASTGTYHGTYWMGQFSYIGTNAEHGIQYDHILGRVGGVFDYYIRTGSNGTTFTDWISLTGTRQFNTESKSIQSLDTLYIGTNVNKGNYAQLMAVVSTINGTGTFGRPDLNCLRLQSRLEIDDNYIIESGEITNQIESDFKMGNFITDRYGFTMLNTPSVYLNKNRLVGEK